MNHAHSDDFRLVTTQVRFNLGGQTFVVSDAALYMHGITGLPFKDLEKHSPLGKFVMVEIFSPANGELVARLKAYFSHQISLESQNYGLLFDFSDHEQRNFISALVAKHGIAPTSYIRRHTRIRANPSISSFPLQAISFLGYDTESSMPIDLVNSPVIFDVIELSPSGGTFYTENQSADKIGPNDRIHLLIQGRGEVSYNVLMETKIIYVQRRFNANSSNIARHLGVLFERPLQNTGNDWTTIFSRIVEQSNGMQDG